MPYLSDPILVLLIPLILLLLFLVVQYFKHSRNPWQEKYEEKSYEILHQAIKKAENIIANAELAGIKNTAEKKITIDILEKQYQQQLQSIEQQFKTYLDTLSSKAEKSEALSENAIRSQVNILFEKFENNLSSFLTETQQQSIKALQLEMQASRQLIETYKTQQFNLIDENIVAMLERTLSLVLIKKLSLKEQVDLVYESLEKAKVEKFIL